MSATFPLPCVFLGTDSCLLSAVSPLSAIPRQPFDVPTAPPFYFFQVPKLTSIVLRFESRFTMSFPSTAVSTYISYIRRIDQLSRGQYSRTDHIASSIFAHEPYILQHTRHRPKRQTAYPWNVAHGSYTLDLYSSPTNLSSYIVALGPCSLDYLSQYILESPLFNPFQCWDLVADISHDSRSTSPTWSLPSVPSPRPSDLSTLTSSTPSTPTYSRATRSRMTLSCPRSKSYSGGGHRRPGRKNPVDTPTPDFAEYSNGPRAANLLTHFFTRAVS